MLTDCNERSLDYFIDLLFSYTIFFAQAQNTLRRRQTVFGRRRRRRQKRAHTHTHIMWNYQEGNALFRPLLQLIRSYSIISQRNRFRKFIFVDVKPLWARSFRIIKCALTANWLHCIICLEYALQIEFLLALWLSNRFLLICLHVCSWSDKHYFNVSNLMTRSDWYVRAILQSMQSVYFNRFLWHCCSSKIERALFYSKCRQTLNRLTTNCSLQYYCNSYYYAI